MASPIRLREHLWSRLGKTGREPYEDQNRLVHESIRQHLQLIVSSHRGASPACPLFGIPDLTGILRERPFTVDHFCAALEKALMENEPRLEAVRVSLGDTDRPDPTGVKFTIFALIKGERNELALTAEVDPDAQVSVV